MVPLLEKRGKRERKRGCEYRGGSLSRRLLRCCKERLVQYVKGTRPGNYM